MKRKGVVLLNDGKKPGIRQSNDFEYNPNSGVLDILQKVYPEDCGAKTRERERERVQSKTNTTGNSNR